ncbi:hypothetical protein K9U39_19495 [Rhodoblastus acidophilus]|uniref:Uncharacterized protein n=1 Tax=Candidatus Rhodoblastus alkanivorans TaxID=2954117 RepID=A0ABS9Z3W1_9HYPH|nr:hypothetical protein [Candidatus Rhodoblastus alkanivorans]MCI4682040.1 hypothetical protein [Candidatus Rhodoblastus alkanivorans]MDI4643091.1 hypothetical protein [Rhodoblastus acidophilus]
MKENFLTMSRQDGILKTGAAGLRRIFGFIIVSCAGTTANDVKQAFRKRQTPAERPDAPARSVSLPMPRPRPWLENQYELFLRPLKTSADHLTLPAATAHIHRPL